MDGVRCNWKADGQMEFDEIGEVEYCSMEQRRLHVQAQWQIVPLVKGLIDSIAIP